MLSKILSTASMLGALLLTSCASNLDFPEVDWQHGAKRGWIVKIYAPDEVPGVDFPECPAALSKTELATKHLVKITYRHVRQMFSAIVEVPDALQVKMDDQVEFWPEDCSSGKFGRISRLLSSVSQ